MSQSSAEYKALIKKVVFGLALRLSERQIEQLATHFSLLVRWNQKINLTAVRQPEQIAVRHFEESLFLVKVLSRVGGGSAAVPAAFRASGGAGATADLLVDVGSGGGFPGLPIKIASPAMTAVLLEPNQRKTAFLKEVIRHCGLEGIEVRSERLEDVARGELAGGAALVTLRAVALTRPVLADLRKLLATDGQLALFLGEKDALALAMSPELHWEKPVAIPHSERRVILVGRTLAG